VLTAFCGLAPASDTNPVEVQYNRDIRPILAENCFACHGADSAARQADLRLDKSDAAEEMGAIIPGEVEASELVRRIRLDDSDDLAMPPNTGHKRLTAEQRAMLENWIAQGAKYEAHWAFQAPVRGPLPDVKRTDWTRNPVDHFILAEIEKAGLEVAPEADRRTLARRLALDLTGLPPTPEAVDEFVADSSPEYYERYVDQLLESTRWGEHRGRLWLDYARFADTHGIHFDNYREMWSYRDWVIGAFNRNLPFNDFTVQQLAGDLLPSPTLEQLVASGFNRCNITTNEGGIIDEEYKVLYARDRTETTSAVWLGLTTGCAVCHDHKFDPVSAKEFYSLSAFFNNTTQAVRDGNVRDTPPIVTVPMMADRGRFVDLDPLIVDARANVERTTTEARQTFQSQPMSLNGDETTDSIPSEGLVFHAMLAEGAGPAVMSLRGGKLRLNLADAPLRWVEGHTAPAALAIEGDSTVQVGDVGGDFEFDKSFSYGAWVYPTRDNISGSVIARMDEATEFRGFDMWLENNRVGGHIINKWPENSIKVVTQQPLAANRWQHVFITYKGTGDANDLQIYVDGQLRTDRNVSGTRLTATIKNSVPLRIGGRSNSGGANGTHVNDVRIYDSMLQAETIQDIAGKSRIAYVALKPDANRSDAEKESLFAYWAPRHAPEFVAATTLLQSLENERAAIVSRGTIAHIMNERSEPAEAFILERGEYDRQGEKVGAGTPASLPKMADDLPRNRLGLAQWLVSDDHPLTTRVTVNRFWQEIFGTGLVATSGDFGIMGELPSHPELLDWLAIEFRDTGWDVKRLIRLYVTSATYRQSAMVGPEKLAVDPANRLLARGPRFRIDAEMIRDYALSVSGLLSSKIGGPSVRPYQPEGVWEAVAMPGSDTRDYKADAGESLYRRSMYTFWKRSAPPASMDIFNAPSREVCTIRRERTNTPLQALAALNDPQFIEAARHLATRVIENTSDAEARIDAMARRVLQRPLSDQERTILAASVQPLVAYYAANPDDANALIAVGETPASATIDASELAAYTMLANQLLNVDETITK